VLEALWRLFLQHPIFGVAPDEVSGRFGFAENFWLSVAAVGGIVGIVIALAIFAGLYRAGYGIWRSRRVRGADPGLTGMYLSAILVMFGISLFESVFAGIITAHTMTCYLYMGGSQSWYSAVTRLRFSGGRGGARVL